MWTLALQLVSIGLRLQVTACGPSCTLYGLKAACSSQGHHWLPALPPNITHLYLDMNRIGEVNSTALRQYEQLQELDLGMQHVQLVIRSNAFLRQRKLIRLVLGSNRDLRLESRAFAGLFSLKELFLDYCDLNDSILAGGYLQPLLSLEMLDLCANRIQRPQPGQFFSRLTKFTQLSLKLNKFTRLCEGDLVGFRGKHFAVLNLKSTSLGSMYEGESCGNPFRGMAFDILDVSGNGFSTNNTRTFLKAIRGTLITQLIFSHSNIGKGFSHDNLPDPDESTFEGLVDSAVDAFNLSKCFIFALQTAVFSPLTAARIIDVSKNKINEIHRNAFNGLQGHLRMLNLSNNLLGEVYSHTFGNLTDLRVLDLSFNHIGVLGYHAFSGLPKLRALYLTGNSLRDLGSPASLPNLDWLLLGDNKLTSLYSITNLGTSSIHLDLRGNRLTNLEDFYFVATNFKRLQNFFYNGNFIKWCTLNRNITVPYNNTLKVLDLSDSFLQTIWAQGKCLHLFDQLNNLLGLSISSNSLTTLPQGIFRGLSSIIEIDLSSNSLTFLQPHVLPVSLKRLDLSNNFLASPDPTAFQSLLFLSLADNRFHCDCSLERFLQWLNVKNVTFLSPAEDFTCEFPAALYKLPLQDYSMIVEPCEKDDEELVRHLKCALFIFSALLITTVTLGGVAYGHLRGHIFVIYKKIVRRVLEGQKATPPVEEAQYDAFLCFSNNDYAWVEAALLHKLDDQFSEENMFHCCFEARDFLPGEDHLSNIRDAIWGSRKTVCVISKEFLKDGWCLEAFILAQGRMLEELTNVLVLLVVGKVAHYQLLKFNAIRRFVQKREYLVWPEDPQDLERFYERLISRILQNTKVEKVAEDGPRPAPQPGGRPQRRDDVELEDIRAMAM